MLGEKRLNVPANVVETFKTWNTLKQSEEEYDERMTIALLLLYVNPHDLANNCIDASMKEFISGRNYIYIYCNSIASVYR